MSEVTRILAAIEQGDRAAADELLPLVYDELRRLAVQKMALERPGQTLQATALVHEAYLRLVGGESPTRWNDQGHFFATAAEAMRRILIENARRRNSLKRGGELNRVPFEPELVFIDAPGVDDIFALNEALDDLAAHDERKATLVKLRLFAGLLLEEAAAALGISTATAKRDWVYARAWLYGRLADEIEK